MEKRTIDPFINVMALIIITLLALSWTSNGQTQPENSKPISHTITNFNKIAESIASATNGMHVRTMNVNDNPLVMNRNPSSRGHGTRRASIAPGIFANDKSKAEGVKPYSSDDSNPNRQNPTLITTNTVTTTSVHGPEIKPIIPPPNTNIENVTKKQNDTFGSPIDKKNHQHDHTKDTIDEDEDSDTKEPEPNNRENSPRILINTPTQLPTPKPDMTMTGICSICFYRPDVPRVICSAPYQNAQEMNILNLNSDCITNQTEELEVRGFEVVRVNADAFANSNLKLKLILFENINRLELVKHSFHFGSKAKRNSVMILKIHNSYIPKFPKEGLTQSVHEHHERQRQIQFEKTRYISVKLTNCRIDEIEEHAFAEARVHSFNITNSTIKKMGKKSIDLDVYEICTINSNELPVLVPEAICLHAKKTVIAGNNIKEIGNRSIVIETESQVLFRANRVSHLRGGALSGIRPMDGVEGANIVFLQNVIENPYPSSLYINSSFPVHEIKVVNNTFHLECQCNISNTFKSLMDTKAYYDQLSYKSFLKSSRCLEPMTRSTTYIEEFLADECTPFPVAIVSAVVAAIVLFVIAVTVCVICSLRVQHAKEEVNMLGECTSQSFSTLSRLTNDHPDILKYSEGQQQHPLFAVFPWMNAVPEVRTYQQSQITDCTEVTESICGGSTLGSIRGRTNERCSM